MKFSAIAMNKISKILQIFRLKILNILWMFYNAEIKYNELEHKNVKYFLFASYYFVFVLRR